MQRDEDIGKAQDLRLDTSTLGENWLTLDGGRAVFYAASGSGNFFGSVFYSHGARSGVVWDANGKALSSPELNIIGPWREPGDTWAPHDGAVAIRWDGELTGKLSKTVVGDRTTFSDDRFVWDYRGRDIGFSGPSPLDLRRCYVEPRATEDAKIHGKIEPITRMVPRGYVEPDPQHGITPELASRLAAEEGKTTASRSAKPEDAQKPDAEVEAARRRLLAVCNDILSRYGDDPMADDGVSLDHLISRVGMMANIFLIPRNLAGEEIKKLSADVTAGTQALVKARKESDIKDMEIMALREENLALRERPVLAEAPMQPGERRVGDVRERDGVPPEMLSNEQRVRMMVASSMLRLYGELNFPEAQHAVEWVLNGKHPSL